MKSIHVGLLELTLAFWETDVVINSRLCDQPILAFLFISCVMLGYYLTFLSPSFLI